MTSPRLAPSHCLPTLLGGVPLPSPSCLAGNDGQQLDLKVLQTGFRLPLGSHQGPLTLFSSILIVSGLLEKQAIQDVPSPQPPGFYGRLFVVPKSSGGWRPVLDLSALNIYLHRIYVSLWPHGSSPASPGSWPYMHARWVFVYGHT